MPNPPYPTSPDYKKPTSSPFPSVLRQPKPPLDLTNPPFFNRHGAPDYRKPPLLSPPRIKPATYEKPASQYSPKIMQTSREGRAFIERHEEQAGVSNHLHWPGGHSGVTLGPGYDMGSRSASEVSSKLQEIGIDKKTADIAAQGAGLTENAARTFAHNNQSLLNLTDDQQDRLLQVNLPHYENMVKKGIYTNLSREQFDALVSFVYNPGSGWPTVRSALNYGDVDRAMKTIGNQTHSGKKVFPGLVRRRWDEAMLFLLKAYDVPFPVPPAQHHPHHNHHAPHSRHHPHAKHPRRKSA